VDEKMGSSEMQKKHTEIKWVKRHGHPTIRETKEYYTKAMREAEERDNN
jgi:RecG-like helicase